MSCDVCDQASTRQDVTGYSCERHHDSMREAYLGYFRRTGGSNGWKCSDERAKALGEARIIELHRLQATRK